MRHLLVANGIKGWRRRIKLFGNPDFVWRTKRLALFIDGCFWHGCPIHGHIPASRTDYWTAKLVRNHIRDRLVTKKLRERGWVVVRIWECSLRRRPNSILKRILRKLE
jgi:DNA mismatch endonuclease, patch repair protein